MTARETEREGYNELLSGGGTLPVSIKAMTVALTALAFAAVGYCVFHIGEWLCGRRR